MVKIPRVLIAAPGSDQGKTTVAMGLMAALRSAGDQVAPFKVGPDYIDPGFHAVATGAPGRNLDVHLCGAHRIAPLLAHGAAGADIAVIEGVMGLFDGRLDAAATGSSAQIARLTETPVIVVLDVSRAVATAGAVVAGLASFDPRVRVAGVILNKVGSPAHEARTREAVESTGVPVLGAIPNHPRLAVPARHLGLVPVAERAELAQVVAAAGELIAQHVDLAALRQVAASAPELATDPWAAEREVTPVPSRPRVAMAAGRAFTFHYAETTELLAAAGCEVVHFDPLHDPRLPEGVAGLYLGGGFPEEFAEQLASNHDLLAHVRAAVAAGLPTYAECAGLLYLCRTLDGVPLAGAIDADAVMGPRLTLGYRLPQLASDSLLGPAGQIVHSHEFHRTTIVRAAAEAPAWRLDGRTDGVTLSPAGPPSLFASYQHVHWAGHPELAQRFAAAAAEFAGTPLPTVAAGRGRGVDLHHHGDQDVGYDLIDLAVNVRQAAPDWLAEQIAWDAQDIAAYPDARPAAVALARHHGVDLAAVLPSAGGAEGFALIARALPGKWPLVIHPQFTEPEAALRTAGRRVLRHVLAGDFRLAAAAVPEAADLVFVGNPTNPTGVLQSREEILALRRPGRIVVVDEAFMDAIPGESESVIGGDMAGLIVLRSLTKTWGLAGLRAGYLVGDPELIAACRRQQSPWAVSTPAVRAMVALASPRARAEQEAIAAEVVGLRADLVARLQQAGFAVVAGQAPFVLIDTGLADPQRALARAGFAVRPAGTFPGLTTSWIRVAVRSNQIHRDFVAALSKAKKEETP